MYYNSNYYVLMLANCVYSCEQVSKYLMVWFREKIYLYKCESLSLVRIILLWHERSCSTTHVMVDEKSACWVIWRIWGQASSPLRIGMDGGCWWSIQNKIILSVDVMSAHHTATNLKDQVFYFGVQTPRELAFLRLTRSLTLFSVVLLCQ